MIRRVAFKKAILAGILGAIVWDAFARVVIWSGFSIFDLIYVLGTMVCEPKTPFWQWWIVGISLHAVVGVIWAIFYAYFFWSMFDYPPILQGMIFSFLPMILAGLIMLPQMDLMNERILAGEIPRNGFFALAIGWGGPLAVIGGHLIYGAVLGFFYQNPVGYPVGSKAVNYG